MVWKIIMAVLLAAFQIVITLWLGIRYECIRKEKLFSKSAVFAGLGLCVSTVINYLLFCSKSFSVIEIINFCVVFTLLQAIALIDLKTKTIPNLLLCIGCGARIVLLIAELLVSPETIWISFLRSVVGLGICLLVMLAVSFISKHGIGYGDVKLFAYFGFCLGVLDTYYILFYAALFASVYAVYAVLIKKESKSTKISFGPFTYLGFVAVYFSTFIKG